MAGPGGYGTESISSPDNPAPRLLASGRSGFEVSIIGARRGLRQLGRRPDGPATVSPTPCKRHGALLLPYGRISRRGGRAVWFYQINGFESGPVPLAEMSRLIVKGRIIQETLVREDGGEWVRAESLTSLYPPAPEPWHMVLLDRYVMFGIPVGLALLPWGRVSSTVGILILMPFVVALIRLLVDIARDLKEVRGKPKMG
jgi:hypothetical protein